MSLLDKLKDIDLALFSKMNGDWHTSFFDLVFPFIRDAIFWVPFYVFLLLLVLINFKRRGLYWALGMGLNSWLSDFISSTVIKQHFFRLRPCHEPALAEHIRFLVSYCPVSSSFTSSHAVNHFAAAMFIFITFRPVMGRWWGLIFVWAGLISYAQVYVGVHYPFDITAGAIVGMTIGYFTGKLFVNKIGLLPVNRI